MHNESVSIYVLYNNTTFKITYTMYLRHSHIHCRCNCCHRYLCHCLCCCCHSHYHNQGGLHDRALVEHDQSRSPSSIAYGTKAIVLLECFLIWVLFLCSLHHLFLYDGKKCFEQGIECFPSLLGMLVQIAVMKQVFTDMPCTEHMNVVRHSLV